MTDILATIDQELPGPTKVSVQDSPTFPATRDAVHALEDPIVSYKAWEDKARDPYGYKPDLEVDNLDRVTALVLICCGRLGVPGYPSDMVAKKSEDGTFSVDSPTVAEMFEANRVVNEMFREPVNRTTPVDFSLLTGTNRELPGRMVLHDAVGILRQHGLIDRISEVAYYMDDFGQDPPPEVAKVIDDLLKLCIPEQVIVPSSLLDAAHEWSKTLDRERCGMLVGKRNGRQFVVSEVIERTNVAQYPLFMIDPQEMMDVYARTTKIDPDAELDYIGTMHTHPMSKRGVPSFIDREVAVQPEVWLIKGQEKLEGYYSTGVNDFIPIDIVVVE